MKLRLWLGLKLSRLSLWLAEIKTPAPSALVGFDRLYFVAGWGMSKDGGWCCRHFAVRSRNGELAELAARKALEEDRPQMERWVLSVIPVRKEMMFGVLHSDEKSYWSDEIGGEPVLAENDDEEEG